MKTLLPTVREALSIIIDMFGNDLTHFLWAETVSCQPLHRDKSERENGDKNIKHLPKIIII